MRLLSLLTYAVLSLLPLGALAETPRETLATAMVAEDSEEQAKLVTSLTGSLDPQVVPLLIAWKEGNVYLSETTEGEGDNAVTTRTPVLLEGQPDADGKQKARRVVDDAPLQVDAANLTMAETDSQLRSAMKGLLDLGALVSADPAARLNAVAKLGMSQEMDKLAPLQARVGVEADAAVKRGLREAIALIQLKSEDPPTQLSAVRTLADLGSIPSRDFLEQLRKDAPVGSPVALAAQDALKRINTHVTFVNVYGTVFRGLSLGSVLLVAAIGLAITFGLMGVINMAHGELITVGAYTTYLVQKVFGEGLALSPFGFSMSLPGMHTTGTIYNLYFVVAIPAAFLVSALVGILLERGIIRFLYRRPLESLLATWGVSLVLQQLLRLTFGSNNVQVDSPAWLSGHWTVFDVLFGWNRIFVILFAIAIIVGTTSLLNRTPLGLLIRAVTQNRAMAACVGVPTERVNMLTFAFGSGLAGLSGAFFSQLGNVGPGMGSDHIVDAFMTVVVGGLGSLAGTVLSALSIGVADQSMQQIFDPVVGKIVVLFAIILFFMWRPSGLFVTKSRNLEG